jgi:hypothetical protein
MLEHRFMLRNCFVSLIALLTTTACDKSSPDSAAPEAPGAAPQVVDDASDGVSADAPPPDSEAEARDEAEPADVDEDEPTPAVAASPSGPRPVPADPAEGLTAPTSMATVRLEIKDESGKVFKDTPKVIPWDERFRIPVEMGGRVHEVDVEVSLDGKDVEIVIGYLLEGQELVRNFRLDTRPNKRELVRIEGGIALAITIGSKTVKPKPQKERDRVEAPADADPLQGAER